MSRILPEITRKRKKRFKFDGFKVVVFDVEGIDPFNVKSTLS